MTNPAPGKGDPDFPRVSLVLGAIELGGPIKFEMTKRVGARTVSSKEFSAPNALGKAFAVEMTWTAKGAITMTVDGQPLRSMSLDYPPASVAFVISGVKGEFGNVQAGRSDPAPASCAARA